MGLRNGTLPSHTHVCIYIYIFVLLVDTADFFLSSWFLTLLGIKWRYCSCTLYAPSCGVNGMLVAQRFWDWGHITMGILVADRHQRATRHASGRPSLWCCTWGSRAVCLYSWGPDLSWDRKRMTFVSEQPTRCCKSCYNLCRWATSFCHIWLYKQFTRIGRN